MKKTLKYALLLAGMTSLSAMAHTNYNGRNFGTFDQASDPSTITNRTVSGNYGWIDGTDADYGDSHKTTVFRFTLLEAANVTLSFESQAFTNSITGATALGGLNPGFSLYQGLAHLPPLKPDYDASDISKANRPASAEGAFRALNDWKYGNDPDPVNGIPAALSLFKYIGHAYDGSVNYGNGVIAGGDGMADGKISHTFTNLAAGDYSVFVGGTDYLAQDIANPNLLSTYGLNGTLSVGVVPEPETYAMLLAGLGLMGAVIRRRKLTAEI